MHPSRLSRTTKQRISSFTPAPSLGKPAIVIQKLREESPRRCYRQRKVRERNRSLIRTCVPRVCGILETEDAQHVGRFSKLTTAGLVIWPLCFIADRLLKMLGEGKIGAKWCEAALARSNGVDASATFPASSHFVDVPHVRQQFHWDCGLACVLMVLRTVGIGHIDIHQLVDLCSTTSVWTVDLAYLLKRFSISFHFFTVTIGANPKFSDETFYREQLKDDVSRVDGLFEKALETGIVIECMSMNGVDIAALISSGQYIAVALVDKIKLSQSQQKDGFFSVGSSDYMGLHLQKKKKLIE